MLCFLCTPSPESVPRFFRKAKKIRNYFELLSFLSIFYTKTTRHFAISQLPKDRKLSKNLLKNENQNIRFQAYIFMDMFSRLIFLKIDCFTNARALKVSCRKNISRRKISSSRRTSLCRKKKDLQFVKKTTNFYNQRAILLVLFERVFSETNKIIIVFRFVATTRRVCWMCP